MNILFAFLLLFFVSCSKNGSMDCSSLSSENKEEILGKIQDILSIDFPKNTSVDHYIEFNDCIDPIWMAKLYLPTLSYEQLDISFRAKPNSNSVCENDLVDSLSWWVPTDIISTYTFIENDSDFVRITISKEENMIAIYIEYIVV